MSLPTQLLIRIFSDPSIKLNQHETAYQAIVDHFRDHNDLGIFVILSFLNGEKLNKESLQECIKEADSRCGFYPKLNYSSFEEKMERKDAQIEKLEQIVSSQQVLIANIKSKLDEQVIANKGNKDKISELQREISLLKGEISNEKNTIERLYQYQKDPEFIGKFTNFFIPIGKKWEKLNSNINHFFLKNGNKTYYVTASSTYSDINTPAENLSVDDLFNGKNEYVSGSEWVSNNSGQQSIMISFSEPVCVNTIWITVRNENCNQIPKSFSLFANESNEYPPKGKFVFIKQFGVMSYSANEKLYFTFVNIKSYCHYKLELYDSNFRNQYGPFFGFSELNLGNFQL